MLPLTVNDGGYLTVDTDAWLDDISEIDETWTNVFNAYCDMRKAADYSFYVTDSVVRDWANSLGTATGIYGEDGPFYMATINYDTFLESEIAYTFLHLEREVTVIRDEFVCKFCGYEVYSDGHGSWIDITDGDGCDNASGVHSGIPVTDTETHHDSLVIVHGHGAFYSSNDCEVRVFTGDDDGDIVNHSSGVVSHTTREDCSKDWILDGVSILWNNGGNDSVRVDDCVMPDDEGNPQLVCPECGDILLPFTN